MHALKVLHKTFPKSVSDIDKRNHCTLLEAAATLTDCRHLSIAGLGRHLQSQALVKHSIKRMDRLFGNPSVQYHSIDYYRHMTSLVIKQSKHPVILIDWSGLTPCGAFHFLRASVPVGSRAITVYEKSYRESEYNKPAVHRAFLEKLKKILPSDCQPIIVTDAGFRCTWFKLIETFSWHYVGRVRNRTQYQCYGESIWTPIKNLYTKATKKPRYLFEAKLAKANSVTGHFYLFKSKAKQRKHKNLRGKRVRCSSSLKHAKRGHEPWLIFSSLPINDYSPHHIIKLYAQRMQIEEAFRDLKNTNNGLSLRHCRSYQKGRLNIALLIAAIATFLLWLIGLVAQQKNIHRSFQSNSNKTCNVLSIFTLGWQLLKRKEHMIRRKEHSLALKQLHINFVNCINSD